MKRVKITDHGIQTVNKKTVKRYDDELNGLVHIEGMDGTFRISPSLARLNPSVGVTGKDESILDEAGRLVNGPRNNDYGHPYDDFKRVAAMWSVILGHTVHIDKVALCMIAVKISRECNTHKRDNLVDISGYAACAEKVLVKIKEINDGILK